MKIFYKKDGGIVQLIDKEKIKEWPIELPLIFIEYIRNNQLKTYEDSKLKKDIEQYLDEVLEDVAIPGLIKVLDGVNFERRTLQACRALVFRADLTAGPCR